MKRPPCILFLLDWQPKYWSTREEYFLRLSKAIAGRGILPLLTISGPAEDRVSERFESAGARVVMCPYTFAAYWHHVRSVAAAYDVRIAQIRFFDYFSLIPWICRLNGAGPIVFTEANSGEFRAGGWKAALLRLRTCLVCAPLARAVAISEFIRRRLVDCGIPEAKTVVIYNGVDTATFAPSEFAPSGEEIRIAFASALLDWKRPDVALRVCAELARRGRRLRLFMMGTGPLRSRLEDLERETGIPVEWLDHCPDPQRVIGGADVFLHTAVGEAFGNVLAEAMACGTPVVATASGAAAEIVEDGVSGVLVPVGPEELSGLANAIDRVLADPSMRGAGIGRARQQFSVDRAIAGTLAIYEELGAFR